jgi:hypothetical protein
MNKNPMEQIRELRNKLDHFSKVPVSGGAGRQMEEGTKLNAAITVQEIDKILADSIEADEGVVPIGWVFQHGDTGRMSFCENDGINNPENFSANNPRHVLCGPAYGAPPAQPVMITDALAHWIIAAVGDIPYNVMTVEMVKDALQANVPDQVAKVDAEGNPLALVAKRDAENYCRILSLLGMKEEGDPVSEVERLLTAAEPVAQGEVQTGTKGRFITDQGYVFRAEVCDVLLRILKEDGKFSVIDRDEFMTESEYGLAAAPSPGESA